MAKRRREATAEEQLADPVTLLRVDGSIPYAEACLRQFINRYVVIRDQQPAALAELKTLLMDLAEDPPTCPRLGLEIVEVLGVAVPRDQDHPHPPGVGTLGSLPGDPLASSAVVAGGVPLRRPLWLP